MNFIETTDGYIARDRVLVVTSTDERDHVQYLKADGTPARAELLTPLHMVLGETIVPAMPGFRVVRVTFADAAGPPLISVAPVIAWRVHAETGNPEPVTPFDAELDARSADCAVEGGVPGVVSHGVRYVTLDAFVEARRDALREATARRAAEAEADAARRATRVEKPLCMTNPVFGCDDASCAACGECLGESRAEGAGS